MASYSFNVEKWQYFVLEMSPRGPLVVRISDVSRIDCIRPSCGGGKTGIETTTPVPLPRWRGPRESLCRT